MSVYQKQLLTQSCFLYKHWHGIQIHTYFLPTCILLSLPPFFLLFKLYLRPSVLSLLPSSPVFSIRHFILTLVWIFLPLFLLNSPTFPTRDFNFLQCTSTPTGPFGSFRLIYYSFLWLHLVTPQFLSALTHQLIVLLLSVNLIHAYTSTAISTPFRVYTSTHFSAFPHFFSECAWKQVENLSLRQNLKKQLRLEEHSSYLKYCVV